MAWSCKQSWSKHEEMREKISVGIINYLNVKPFLYGIERSPVMQQIELVETYPSKLAEMLLRGAIHDGGAVKISAGSDDLVFKIER